MAVRAGRSASVALRMRKRSGMTAHPNLPTRKISVDARLHGVARAAVGHALDIDVIFFQFPLSVYHAAVLPGRAKDSAQESGGRTWEGIGRRTLLIQINAGETGLLATYSAPIVE